MSFMKKAAAAAVLAMGLSAGAQAAVQTFVFTHKAKMYSAALASYFGVEDSLYVDVVATLHFDPTLKVADAIHYEETSEANPNPDMTWIGSNQNARVATYKVELVEWVIGNKTATSDGDIIITDTYAPNSGGFAQDNIEFTTWIYPSVFTDGSFGDEILWFGAYSDRHDSFDGVDADRIFEFNNLDSSVMEITFATVSQPKGHLVTMTTPAVPEPATWLTLIMGFGLAGVAMRRRRLVLAA
ncbi:PEPxxWA-CTERM sorting domain-containing protein [Gimibacter soli]|uniref:PEPxxWA-CTERM sorting domain-containing protein n=1 Tax=Gimibacter soli TaxID=3024400 RepID=A0AAF0BK92_9PROT|nr:PEPxxWA-CTERM sorting domain-containing protein [Gimibacter soli]WCL54014.1 PEPxxWA-CTERM sorting domain-containing protein [Gimibacter soli]